MIHASRGERIFSWALSENFWPRRIPAACCGVAFMPYNPLPTVPAPGVHTPAPGIRHAGWFGLALLAVTLLAYLPAIRSGFVWNDEDYVTAPALRSLDGLGRIWIEPGAVQQYYPVLHSAFWLEHRLWGDNPTGYHLINILLHAGAAWLLAQILLRLTVPGAWLAAAVFALHPVCVESVAWISEQKNTLSLCFYLAAALDYLRFAEQRTPRVYLRATALFALAVLSKSVTATLPAALLVLHWWRHGRLEWRRDVVPLLPWFVLGAVAGLFTAWVERKYIGAVGTEFDLNGLQRGLVAGRVIWFYLGKLVWPVNLAFFYPRWTIDATAVASYGYGLGVFALLLVAWRTRRRTRAPLAALLFFGGSLFPVLGFFNVYAFYFSFVADHLQYLPAMGIITLLCSGVTLALARARPWLRSTLTVVLLVTIGTLTWHQALTYGDLEIFYRSAIARNPAAWVAHNNLGLLLAETGRSTEAAGEYNEALRLKPDYPKAHFNLGLVLREVGRAKEATVHLREAVRLQPEFVGAHNALGQTLAEAGRTKEAIEEFGTAIRLNPTSIP